MGIEIKNASITYVLEESSEITITMEQNLKTREHSYEFLPDFSKFENLEDIVELVEDFKSRIKK